MIYILKVLVYFLVLIILGGCHSIVNTIKVGYLSDDAYQTAILNRGLSIAKFNFTNIKDDFEIVATSYEYDKIIERKVIHTKEDLSEFKEIMISINDLNVENNLININSLTNDGIYFNKKLKYNPNNYSLSYVKQRSIDEDVNIEKYQELRLLLIVSSKESYINDEMSINQIDIREYHNAVIVSLNKKN